MLVPFDNVISDPDVPEVGAADAAGADDVADEEEDPEL